MRILFVLSRVPYPLEKGDKLRAFHLIRELSKQHEIFLFCLADQRINPEAEEKLKEYCAEVYIHRIPFYQKLIRLGMAIFNKMPFQVSYFYSKQAQRKFDHFLEAHLPQHIFCQLIRTSEYARKYSVIPKTIDYMDAFSAGMERMAKRANWPMNWVMNNEFRRLQQYEASIADCFDHHTIISEQDRNAIKIKQPITILPNGIGPQFFDVQAAAKSRDVLFTGNMSYRPNVESARFLVKDIMPIVWRTLPETKVCLAGATPSSSVLALAGANVEVTGWVEDITAVYASAKVFVAPMLINSGLQNKLLEAMATGLPCVTTKLANNALGAAPRTQVCLAETKEAFAAEIVQLLKDERRSTELAKAGQQFVLEQYSWKREAKRLESLMQLAH